ncbi:hypothetical protein AMS68_000405 [Peltaster fructicola]|uniref:Uncharacterized protein n=1 Tax=Peltaster fructicola TaxID=286661 RepID=A0A6H0XJS6_9PEZI|nr:hypothetical protein AMS68_000405 [Peltaster fructicola]
MNLANDSQSSLGMDTSPEQADDSLRREYEERCRVSPVHRLPAELLIHIFSRLSETSDLASCLLVSREWARNSVALLWHRPTMSGDERLHKIMRTINKAGKMFEYQDLVKRFNMSTSHATISDGILYAMRDCKRIERLTLTSCSKLSDRGLVSLLNRNRSLLALDIHAVDQVTDETMLTVAHWCMRLQGLNVSGCKKLTDASIQAVARNCRQLKRLKFNGCAQLTDASILTIAAHSSNLLEIDLEELRLLESPAVTALLSSCHQLRELRLPHCTSLDDSAFLDLSSTVHLDALRILDLSDCNEITDKGVEKIIQICPRLRNLILAKCRQLTDRAVFAITRLGKNLHYIHLGHCGHITDASVKALANACNRIRYIDLACCSNLTDDSITRLAGLPKLKRIGLVKCAGITDRSIYSLAMGEVRNGRRVNGVNVLERVHLSYCTHLTLDGIHMLLIHCPKLTHLSLTGVQAFLQEELLHFCRDAPVEFNDHQRDVFCVFSGIGVARLRDHLVRQKQMAIEAAEAAGSATPSAHDGSDMGDEMDDNAAGSGTNVINVGSTFPPGMTPIAGPRGPRPTWNALAAQDALNLSQSAPAATGGALWADGQIPVPRNHPVPPPQAAQHVTGMMGATALDDVDEEGDDAFGDESELME